MERDEQQEGPDSLLGKEQVFHADEPIGEAMIRRFAAAVGDSNPLHWDEEYAQRSPWRGIVAPPTLLFELTYDIGGTIDQEKGLYQGLLSWAGHPEVLERAGNEYEIWRPVRPNDVITIHRKITKVQKKKGRTGTWTFVTTQITYTNQSGELVGTDKETLACRY